MKQARVGTPLFDTAEVDAEYDELERRLAELRAQRQAGDASAAVPSAAELSVVAATQPVRPRNRRAASR